MGRLSTHVLDTVHGRPAPGVVIALDRLTPDGGRERIAQTMTNLDGRTDAPLLAGAALVAGTYEISFSIGAYFRGLGMAPADPTFLDIVPIRFGVADPQGHYHIPLLATPWSYSTYRGS